MKLFMKYFRKLSTILREMFMISVQYLHKILQESFRNFFWNDSGNRFRETLQKSFCKILRLRFEVFSEEAFVKYFNKSCSKLARTFREVFVFSVQTIHKIFRKSIRNLPCNDCGNLYATFPVIFRQIFLQGCGNIGSKIFWPRSEYFEKLCTKVSARFCVWGYKYLHRKLAWNISINVAPKLSEHCVKCLCSLPNHTQDISEKFHKTFRAMIVGMFTQHFL